MSSRPNNHAHKITTQPSESTSDAVADRSNPTHSLQLLRLSHANSHWTNMVRFGLIADIHKDVIHDADERLTAFLQHMREEKVDFILQLGDFCAPTEANRPFVELWNSFEGNRYHVLGNHDVDDEGQGPTTRQHTMTFWDMPRRFYAFDQGDVHFVVLDGNDRCPGHEAGYPCFVADDQLEWLRCDLSNTHQYVVVFIHQSIENNEGVENGEVVRAVLQETNENRAGGRVIACFSGHHHRDYLRQINGIHYPQINSGSYFWIGPGYPHQRYSDTINTAYPYIKYTVPYRNSIYALVTIDTHLGVMRINGQRSEFVGPAPWDLGGTKKNWDADTLTPHVSDRLITFEH